MPKAPTFNTQFNNGIKQRDSFRLIPHRLIPLLIPYCPFSTEIVDRLGPIKQRVSFNTHSTKWARSARLIPERNSWPYCFLRGLVFQDFENYVLWRYFWLLLGGRQGQVWGLEGCRQFGHCNSFFFSINLLLPWSFLIWCLHGSARLLECSSSHRRKYLLRSWRCSWLCRRGLQGSASRGHSDFMHELRCTSHVHAQSWLKLPLNLGYLWLLVSSYYFLIVCSFVAADWSHRKVQANGRSSQAVLFRD